MNWRNTSFLIMFFALCAVGWLAYQRFPYISYGAGFDAVSGWPALLAGWPVYVLIGAVAMFVGLPLGAWVGENSRERDAAEHLANQRALLEEQQRKSHTIEQKAREKAAEAAQARRDAEALIAPAQQRINALSEENALLKRRLTGSIEALERKKRQLRELKKNGADVLLANAEIERLRGMIREDRQQMQRLEERLHTAKSAVS